MGRKRANLVSQHVERMSGRLFDQHPDVIREYVRGKRGIYALYRRAKLYYVGLASDLRSRLKAHLRDRHAGKWDSFSIYLTETAEHLRELEALALRITMPKGNKSKTKFGGSRDLRRYFKQKIAEKQRQEIAKLFGPTGVERRAGEGTRKSGKKPSLAGYIDGWMSIRMGYHKKVYKATVLADGTIRFRGKLYNSPTMAAKSVARRAVNGWWWWKYEKTPGKWVRLTELRN
jgi:hypothetical protein